MAWHENELGRAPRWGVARAYERAAGACLRAYVRRRRGSGAAAVGEHDLAQIQAAQWLLSPKASTALDLCSMYEGRLELARPADGVELTLLDRNPGRSAHRRVRSRRRQGRRYRSLDRGTHRSARRPGRGAHVEHGQGSRCRLGPSVRGSRRARPQRHTRAVAPVRADRLARVS